MYSPASIGHKAGASPATTHQVRSVWPFVEHSRRSDHTVLRSDMTRTMLPCPAISTTFSCQLSSTLMAWAPPSPPPMRGWTCEKPVGWGETALADGAVGATAMPLYLQPKQGASAAARVADGAV